MKSRRRDRDPGKRKGGGGGGTREDDGVMSMGRGIEVVKENKVLEVKEVGRLRPLNMVSSRTFFSLDLGTVSVQAGRALLQLEPTFGRMQWHLSEGTRFIN